MGSAKAKAAVKYGNQFVDGTGKLIRINARLIMPMW
jgi:hypothetical protein